jgi:6-phosphogluconolactonase/glucosamine-6-phosphate isomerase/deaminase
LEMRLREGSEKHAMKIQVFADANSVAQGAAVLVAAEARAAVAAHGSFVMAVSGGHTRGLCFVL